MSNTIRGTQQAEPQLQLQTKVLRPSQFSSLPQEILLHIFSYLLHSKPNLQGSDEIVALREARVSLLLLSKTHYNLLGPGLYQTNKYFFRNPVTFANDFLSRCTDLCLQSLRYLECNLSSFNVKRLRAQVQYDFKKLQEVLCVYTELKRLSSFTLTFHAYYIEQLTHRVIARSTQPETTLWERHEDWDWEGEMISNFEKRMMKRTFKSFALRRSTVTGRKGYSGERRQALMLQFTKP